MTDQPTINELLEILTHTVEVLQMRLNKQTDYRRQYNQRPEVKAKQAEAERKSGVD